MVLSDPKLLKLDHLDGRRFECAVELPGWRLNVAQLVLWEGRDLGNVMDTAIGGAIAHLLRAHPGGALEENPTLVAIREGARRLGVDPERTPPSSERIIRDVLAARDVVRGSLVWEFLFTLIAKSHAPWSVLDGESLRPPLVFRPGVAGESLVTPDGELDCAGLPVLADASGVLASPWNHGGPTMLDSCRTPLFVCYLPHELFRKVQPKTHLGQAVWLTWAFRFVFERNYACREDAV